MRTIRGVGIASTLGFALLVAPAVQADCPPDAPEVHWPYPTSPVTLSFRDVPLRTIFQTLGALTGTQFSVASELTYNVSVEIRGQSAGRVLQLLKETQSVSYRQEGGTIFVVAPEPRASQAVPSSSSDLVSPSRDAAAPRRRTRG
jgi:type II secretory pathway component GspD/PulD (secretin)